MIYGDLGLFPITLEINSRAISFWCKLLDCQDKYRLSSIVYTIVHSMHKNRHVKSKWIEMLNTQFALWVSPGYGIHKVILIRNGL